VLYLLAVLKFWPSDEGAASPVGRQGLVRSCVLTSLAAPPRRVSSSRMPGLQPRQPGMGRARAGLGHL
jgi:hypothetical protein